MFKSIVIYRISPGWEQPAVERLDEALVSRRFVACGPTQMESHGFVEPRGQDHGAMVESVAGQLILRIRSESKGVPAAVVKERLDERVALIEKETGRKPGSKQKKELKEEIVFDLLPYAFSKKSGTSVWIDAEAGLLIVGAGSVRRADQVSSLLVETLDKAGAPMVLRLLQTTVSPATAMADWLATQEPPAGFGVDRECELKQPDDVKSAVRYSRHNLEIDEVVEHIRQGKVPTHLALTWEGRVSFVLTDDLTLRKLDFIDGAVHEAQANDDDFDADVAIATAELSRLIPQLIEALGGEMALGGGAAVAPPAVLGVSLKAA